MWKTRNTRPFGGLIAAFILGLAGLLAAPAPAQAVPVLYEVTFTQDNPGPDSFVGTFTADDVAIMSGGGTLLSFLIMIGPETFDLSLGGSITFVSSDMMDVTSISGSLADTLGAVTLDIFGSGFWTAAERDGTYATPVRVTVSEPGILGLFAGGLLLLGLLAKWRQRAATRAPLPDGRTA